MPGDIDIVAVELRIQPSALRVDAFMRLIEWTVVSDRLMIFRGLALAPQARSNGAREVLKAKRDELAAARGGYTTVSGPETRRVSVADRLSALLRDYELRGVRSLAQVRAHLGFPPKPDGAPRRILEAFSVRSFEALCDPGAETSSWVRPG